MYQDAEGFEAAEPGFGSRVTAALSRNSEVFLFAQLYDLGRGIDEPTSFFRSMLRHLSRSSSPFRDYRRRWVLERANFDGAELANFDFSGIRFGTTTMREANLSRANLAGADLHGAKMFRAFLEGADLSRAVARRVDLREANLRACSFILCDLSGALLQDADLRGADFRGANLLLADLRGADLRGARFDQDFDRTTLVSDDATQWPEPV